MEKYKNVGGGSGVAAYEYGTDFIKVRFTTGKDYRYTNKSAGAENIKKMITLAKKGDGLNAFINKEVKYFYEK